MSAGNHAQGLAYSGHKLGVNTNIVMPLGTPFTKIRRTKNFGGNVFLKGNDLIESKNYVNELINKFGYIEVHPYNDTEVIKGQGTIYLEMLNQMSELDYLLVPVGGGGLLAGCSIINNSLFKKTKIAFTEFEKQIKPKEKKFVVAGGVAANKEIRNMLINLCKEEKYNPIFPPIELCGDNAAMIAMVGLEKFKLKQFDKLDYPAKPRWPLDEDAIFLKGAGVQL